MPATVGGRSIRQKLLARCCRRKHPITLTVANEGTPVSLTFDGELDEGIDAILKSGLTDIPADSHERLEDGRASVNNLFLHEDELYVLSMLYGAQGAIVECELADADDKVLLSWSGQGADRSNKGGTHAGAAGARGVKRPHAEEQVADSKRTRTRDAQTGAELPQFEKPIANDIKRLVSGFDLKMSKDEACKLLVRALTDLPEAERGPKLKALATRLLHRDSGEKMEILKQWCDQPWTVADLATAADTRSEEAITRCEWMQEQGKSLSEAVDEIAKMFTHRRRFEINSKTVSPGGSFSSPVYCRAYSAEMNKTCTALEKIMEIRDELSKHTDPSSKWQALLNIPIH